VSNFVYGIPVRLLYDERHDPNTGEFIEGTGIDFGKGDQFRYPTVGMIKKVIRESFQLKTEKSGNVHNEPGWFFAIGNERGESLEISVDEVTDDRQEIRKMIFFPWGDTVLVIEFLKKLAVETGDILYYCDSGDMSLVTADKDIQVILRELGIADSRPQS
jgi:hypothetical protein